MIDLHTHTLFSDGELTPSEHIRRAAVAGYEAIAITDHTDSSNIETLARDIVKFARTMAELQTDIVVLPGVELTHVLPEEIWDLAEYARGKGVKIVVVHGETIVEPVRFGTNTAAIQAKVDILAHPGIITEEEVILAARNNVCLEITAKKGHCLTNGWVAKVAMKNGTRMVVNTDAHAPNDFISNRLAEKILLGAGVPDGTIRGVMQNSRELVRKALDRS